MGSSETASFNLVVSQSARLAPMLTAAQELQLARRARSGDERAFDSLLRAHLRLVLAIVSEYKNYGASAADLAGEGLVGLVEAGRRFDPDRGVRFAVYAAQWVRAYVRRHTLNNRRAVRLPSTRNARRLLAHMQRTRLRLQAENGGEATREQIAAALSVSPHDVEELEQALSARDIPYGVPDADDRPFDLQCPEPSPEALSMRREELDQARARVQRALTSLSERERYVIEQRCLSEPSRTLAEVGGALGVSRERARQLEARARTKVTDTLLAAS